MSPVADLRTVWQPKGQATSSMKARGPIAIVDIGSNSVRLVIYESQTRVAATLQNEKSICAIGRDMVTTGRLHAEGCAAALGALSRFRMISDGLNVEHRDAVATAAARDASNGASRQSHPESDDERAGRQIGLQLEVALLIHPVVCQPPRWLRSSAAASHQTTARHPLSAEQINAVGFACSP